MKKVTAKVTRKTTKKVTKNIIITLLSLLAVTIIQAADFTNNPDPEIVVVFKEQVTNVVATLRDSSISTIPLNESTTDNITFTYTSDSLNSGETYTFTITASDLNGIPLEMPGTITFIIDTTPPLVNILRPTTNQILQNQSVPIDIHASEPVTLRKAIINDDDLLGGFPTDARQFFNTTLALQDGTKTLAVTASDRAGNNGTATQQFTIVTSPLVISLHHPPFGVAQGTPFNVTVKTNRHATCRYSTNILLPYDSMFDFSQSDNLLHVIPTFQGPATVYTRCLDPFNISENNTASFDLSVDLVNPIIQNAFADPAAVEDTPETTLVALTNEEARCKYSEDITPFESMIPFDHYTNGTFSTVSRHHLETSEDAGSYSVIVVCEDKSLRPSPPQRIDYTVNLAQQLSITDHTPSFFSSTIAFLNITTNKNAVCYHSELQDSPFDNPFGPLAKKHFSQLTLHNGPNTFYVTCQRQGNATELARKTITLSVDTTPPILLYVNDTGPLSSDPQTTYFDDRLTGSWLAVDNQSGIDRYHYKIYEDRGFAEDILIDSGSTSDDHETVTGLNLNDSAKYYFRVHATNGIGLNSSDDRSDGITIDVDQTPQTCNDGIRNGNERGIDCGGSCTLGCPLETQCGTDLDCASGFCNKNNFCKTPTCNDGERNHNESDVDCGNACNEQCEIGDSCHRDADCESAMCDVSRGACVGDDRCSNNRLDPGESDIDCGGICISKQKYCEVSKQCEFNSDCASNYCQDSICAQATCSDSLRNGDETDVDCGGSCPVCEKGQVCKKDSDCSSENCNDNRCGEPVDKDNDGLPNDWEQRYGLNPEKFDTDDDGTADGEEDLDNDGLLNIDEWEFGTDPTNKDTDDDGWSDKKEIEKGTNPLDPASKPQSKLLLFLIIFVILALLGAGGYYYYTYMRKPKKPDLDLPPLSTQKPPSKPRPASKPLPKPIHKMLFPTPAKPRKRKRSLLDVFNPPKKQSEQPEREFHPESGTRVGDWITIGPQREKIKLARIFDDLSSLSESDLSRASPDTDAFKRLAKIIGKGASANTLRDISQKATKKQLDTGDIGSLFKSVSKDKKLNLQSYAVILSSLLSSSKIKKKDISTALSRLTKSGDLSQKQVASIMSSLNIKPDPVVGTKTGTKYHRKTCVRIKNMSKDTLLQFKSKKDAESKGLRACNFCHP